MSGTVGDLTGALSEKTNCGNYSKARFIYKKRVSSQDKLEILKIPAAISLLLVTLNGSHFPGITKGLGKK
jgi:hypothetical protein